MVLVRTAAVLAALVVVAGCAHGFEAIDMDALPGAARFPQEDGVVLFERRTVTLRAGEDGAPVAEETVHARVRAFTHAGRERLPLAIYELRPFVELVSLEARVLDHDGDERRLTRADAIDSPALDGVALYADSRLIALPFDDVPLGAVVEYRYTTRQREPHLLAVGHAFEHPFPVVESRFEVRLPPGFEVEHRVFTLEQEHELAPTITRAADGGERLVWERRDLPALRPERYATRRQYAGMEVIARLSRWHEDGVERRGFDDDRALSRWLFEKIDERARPTPEIEALATRVLEGAPDDARERAKRLYAWTRDHITYCAIQIGYGGWFPHPASDTERLRYGDCKDKANLLRALLTTQGIESAVAPVFAHDGLPKPFRLPTLVGNANHAILVIELPGGPVVVDPTTRTVPFGRLPYADQGAELLPATKEGAARWRTPVDAPDGNVLDVELELVLRPKHEVTGTFAMTLLGEPADDLRHALLRTTESGVAEVVDRWVPVDTDGVTDVVLENAAPPLEPTPLRVRGVVDGRGKPRYRRGTYSVRFSDYLHDVVPDLPAGPRRQPVVLGVPSSRRAVVTLRLPKGTRVSGVPAPVALEGPYGTYTLEASVTDDGSFRYARTFIRARGVVPAAEYDELRRFYDAIALAEARLVRISFAKAELP